MAMQTFSSSEVTILFKNSTDTMENPKVRREEKYKALLLKGKVSPERMAGVQQNQESTKDAEENQSLRALIQKLNYSDVSCLPN